MTESQNRGSRATSDHHPAVRFPLTASLLAQLRARRERQRADREAATPARGASRTALSLDRVLLSLTPDADVRALADSYVHGMNDLQGEVEEKYDAFLLDPGMGPMLYLASDGRVLVDNRSWDGEALVVETSLDRAIAALVVGAKKTGVVELLDLIPRLPHGSPCPACGGARYMVQPPVVCLVCNGRGEVDDRLRRRAAQLGLGYAGGPRS